MVRPWALLKGVIGFQAHWRYGDRVNTQEAGTSVQGSCIIYREAQGTSEESRHCLHIKMETAINYQNKTFL